MRAVAEPLVARRLVPSRAPAPRAPRRDPSPSRAAYRLRRLWLTPLYRALLRRGLPAFLLVLALGLWLADAERRARISSWGAEVWRSVEDRPEFRITDIAITGATGDVTAALRPMLAVTLPASSFDIDIAGLRAMLQSLDVVARADIRIAPGGTLEVAITQRRPALVWRGRTGLDLIDATGHRVAGVGSRADRPDLPLVAGDGAAAAAPEALALMAAATPVAARVEGLVRMGERRWDLVLDEGQRILLPEDDPVAALERVLALAAAQNLFDRDIAVVDMRLDARPTLRLAATATPPDPKQAAAGAPAE